ncbi:AbrB family transcriptional regulator [Pseudomonadota bacterium]
MELPSYKVHPTVRVFYTLIIAAIGGYIGDHLRIPLGWLLGAMVAVILSNIASIDLSVPKPIRTIALAVLGLMLGSAFTPETLARVNQWLLTISGMSVYLVLVTPLGVYYYTKVLKMDRVTATFAAVPGGLAAMVMLGISLGGDPRQMALAHTARLTTILVVIPTLTQWISGVEIDTTQFLLRQSAQALSTTDVMILTGCAILGPLLAKPLNMPSPVLFGALVASAAVHMAGITEARPPAELVNLVQIVIGAFIGTSFTKLDYRMVVRITFFSTLLTLFMIALAALFAYGLVQITEFKYAALLLALTPGGIAEMGIIAFLMNIDPVFVAAHHTIRVSMVYLVVPFLSRKWLGDIKPKQSRK